MVRRRVTVPVGAGSLVIGGGAPVSVQGMTKTDTRDPVATGEQIMALAEAGAELVRVAVPDFESARALARIKGGSPIPLAADIHFDYRLALEALEAGVDKLRLNPGNIRRREHVREVVGKAAALGVPIRIGVNAGSLEKKLVERMGRTPEAMVESAMNHVRLLEQLDFTQIVISLKASDVMTTVQAYRLMAEKVDYPFHLGITEAGTPWSGTIKSSVGIGHLLALGLGDTLRVSLTGDPAEEIRVGFEILASLNMRLVGPRIISCPTCGRCEFDLVKVVGEVEKRVSSLREPLQIAIMGCVVNGPGEAVEADVGLAGGGGGTAVLFRQGKVVKRVAFDDMVEELLREVYDLSRRAGVREDAESNGLQSLASGGVDQK